MTIKAKKTFFYVISLLIIIAVVVILISNRKINLEKSKKNVIMQSFPVTVTPVSMKSLDESLAMTGTVYANSEVQVLSETQGRVINLYTDIGSPISKGGPIAKVDDELKQAALISAQANYDKTKKDFERYEKLNKEKSVNDAQVEQSRLAFQTAEAQLIIAKRQLNDTKIVAPISGIVTSKPIEVGSVISMNTPIVTIVDISTLKIRVNIPESDAFKLKTGDNVELTTDVYPGTKFNAKVKSVNAKGDESHTYPVEINMANNRVHPFKSGMFVRINFTTIMKKETMTVPRVCLVGSVREPYVYVVENNIAKLRKILVGSENGNYLEIKSGLSNGELIVTNGQVNLRDNTPVTIVKQ